MSTSIEKAAFLAFHIGDYTISHYTNGVLWITRDDGEGMELGNEEFIKMIDDYYNGRF